MAKLATRRGRRPRRVALRSRWPSAPTSAPEGAEGHFATCEAGSPRRGRAPAENGPENQALPKGSRSKKWVKQNASKNAVFSAKSGRPHELRNSSKDLVQKSAQLWAYPLGLGSFRLFANFKWPNTSVFPSKLRRFGFLTSVSRSPKGFWPRIGALPVWDPLVLGARSWVAMWEATRPG